MRQCCLVFAMVVTLCFWAFQSGADEATGTVYNDKNANGARDAGERGIPNVLVSNGVDIAVTDRAGRYHLSVSEDTVLFVIKPRGWKTPVGPGNEIPRFYYIHKPLGSPAMKYAGVAPTGPLPASVDFPLQQRREDKRFRMLCFGDTQPRNVEEVQYLEHDIIEDLVGADAAFGVTLGDNVFNDLTVFEPIVDAVSQVGVPWYCVPGNHDHNHDAPTAEQTDESFTRVFGPPYYAFNYGLVHFIVLDDIRHEAGRDEYHGGLGTKQLAFLKNDLARVSPKQLVVLLMHIPITELEDRAALFDMLKGFPHTFSISAHTHDQQNVFVDAKDGWPQATPHHHLIQATTCGSWWGGNFDETGIPMTPMNDGGPNGYSYITFDGSTYSVDFQAARRPADYQMNIWMPERVTAADTAQTQAIVNVFAGSSRSRVEMRLDAARAWMPMENFTGLDPYYARIIERQDAFVGKLAEAKGVKEIDKAFLGQVQHDFKGVLRGLPKPADTAHLWRATLPPGLAAGPHLLEVRTTDLYGHLYTAKRLFTVEP